MGEQNLPEETKVPGVQNSHKKGRLAVLDFSVRRIYIAAIAAIGYVLAHRSLSSSDWPLATTLAATSIDALILATMFFCFSILDRILQPKSLATKGHKALHFSFAFATVALAAGAQVLYMKTGEILDFGILTFFFSHFSDLTGASQSVIDQDVVFVAIACFGFYFIALGRANTLLLKAIQYTILCSPSLLLAGQYLYGRVGDENATVATSKTGLYKGNYLNLTNFQMKWLQGERPPWHQGILSALANESTFGISEYSRIEDKITPIEIYKTPQITYRPQQTPNIVFILLESTRADVIGAYSSDASISKTPFLDSLAKDAWIFETAYTTIPHTSKALVGIYCGTFPKFGTNSFESTEAAYPLNCLPKILGKASYATAHFQTAPGSFEGRSQFLINAGIQHAVVQENLNPENQEKYGYLGLDDRLLVSPMLNWMTRQRDEKRPFFASMLTVLTHHPYVSPGAVKPIQDATSAKEGYLRAVEYTDNLLQELFSGMRDRGLLDDTIVVITGDHGEAFGEHGQLAHNGVAYEEGMRVPLIVYAPNLLTTSRRVSGLRQHIDIMPSLLTLLGIKTDGLLPGKDLFSDASGHDSLITSCFYANYCLNHYTADGKKLLYFFGKKAVEFYDLKSDAAEKQNLATSISSDMVRVRLENAALLRKSFDRIYTAAGE